MDFTGYNIQEIENLANAVKASYSRLGEVMAEPWPSLQTTMQAEWVGPDEQSYEKKLADDIAFLYNECSASITTLMRNIVTMGEAWKEFQSRNIISGADTFRAAGQLEAAMTLTPYDIVRDGGVVLKPANYDRYTNYGLTNGQGSYNTINNALEAYISGVKAGVDTLYRSLDSSKAFLGGGQAAAINEYMVRIGQAVANLSTSHNQVKEALATLLASYNAQANENVSAASAADEYTSFSVNSGE